MLYDRGMAEYRAQTGQEDRDGEMTGAISLNMGFCAIPVITWCIFIGPLLMPFWPMLITGIVMACVLPFVFLKPSQKLWAWLSDKAENFD